MTKKSEFKEKWITSGKDADEIKRELESDLDEVIKDELEKFRKHWNGKIDNGRVIGCHINKSDIESYLNQTK